MNTITTIIKRTATLVAVLALALTLTFALASALPQTAEADTLLASWYGPGFEGNLTCDASWYGPGLYGNLTASGAVYTGEAGTAAHPTLPFGTVVGVTNLWTGSYSELVITDRGPYAAGRCLDVSAGSAWLVDYGVAPVSIDVLAYGN